MNFPEAYASRGYQKKMRSEATSFLEAYASRGYQKKTGNEAMNFLDREAKHMIVFSSKGGIRHG